jgi:hypothetical protein
MAAWYFIDTRKELLTHSPLGEKYLLHAFEVVVYESTGNKDLFADCQGFAVMGGFGHDSDYTLLLTAA